MNKLRVIKNNKGITLIALIVTIVILLILAGVTIATLMGDSGIFSKVQTAKDETNRNQATEKMNLKITNVQIDSYAQIQKMPTLQNLADALCEDNEIQYVELTSKEIASLEKVNVGTNKSIYTKLKEYPYEFEINSSLQLASIDGIKIADSSDSASSEEIEKLKTTISDLQTRIQGLENSSEISVTTIDITSPSTTATWTKVASFPAGYTKDNTVVTGHLSNSTGENVVLPYTSSYMNSGLLKSNSALIKKSDDGIYLYVDGSFTSKPGKLFLQKVN